MAAVMGAGPLSDAFFVAFKLPNFFRRLFAEGAFNAAFVPMFSGMLAAEGKEQARKFAEEALSALTFVLLVITAIAMLTMPWITILMAPGFDADPEKFAATVELSRITFPYLLLVSITSLMVGMLNSMDKFAAGAANPILLNLSFIIGMGFFAERAETPAHAAAWAVFAAGVSQVLMMMWCIRRRGMWILPKFPRFTTNVKKLLLLMGPAAFGASVTQISLFIEVILASTLPQAVTYLYYADRVNELPLGVIGIAISTAILPVLSRHWRLGEVDEARNAQNRALELAMFFSLPSCIALMVIAYPVVATLFEYGEFSANDSRLTSYALIAYAYGLPAFVAVKIFAASFFANRDTKTPVKIAMVCVSINIILNLILMRYFAHVGLAISTATVAWLNTIMMGVVLYRRGIFVPDDRLKRRIWRLAAASVFMGVILFFGQSQAEIYFASGSDKFMRAVALAIVIGAGMAAYIIAVIMLKAVPLADIKRLMKKATKK